MRSNGGVLSAEEVVHQPISTVLSGPAAGALGAATIAARAGYGSVLTCDGGGTSTDVAVITDGRPSLTTEGSVGPFPAKIPMIDIVTVGAGGGSVAWVSAEGALKVGPRSAGAHPGPACYGLGGTEPTVTDAHLVLGRIPPHLLGGEIPLDLEAATTAVGSSRRRTGPAGPGLRGRDPGDLGLEPGQCAAPDHHQAGARRAGLPDGHLRRFGFAAGLRPDGHSGHRDRAGPAEPRQCLGLRTAHRRRAERLRAHRRRRRSGARTWPNSARSTQN